MGSRAVSGRKIVIPGGSGFLGRILSSWFTERGYDVVVLSRRSEPVHGARVVVWDGKQLGDWVEEIENAHAIINLSGQSVDCRYSEKNKRVLTDSRILSTRVIGEAITQSNNPPACWLNASTATIYEHTYGAPHTELDGRIAGSPEAKDVFSVELASAWERAFEEAKCPKTRKCIMRMAMVFDPQGSVYAVLKRLVHFGLGGRMGHGLQYVSWIHFEDFCRAVEYLVEHTSAQGVYNISSPNPLQNRDMMAHLRRFLGVPYGLPAFRWMLEIGAVLLRTETELVIKSRRVVPQRLLEEGFCFRYADFETALPNL